MIPPHFFPDWLAGFIEGDGCFASSQRSTQKSPELSLRIKQKDREVLEWVQSCLQDGSISTDRKGYSTCYLGKKNLA